MVKHATSEADALSFVLKSMFWGYGI